MNWHQILRFRTVIFWEDIRHHSLVYLLDFILLDVICADQQRCHHSVLQVIVYNRSSVLTLNTWISTFNLKDTTSNLILWNQWLLMLESASANMIPSLQKLFEVYFLLSWLVYDNIHCWRYDNAVMSEPLTLGWYWGHLDCLTFLHPLVGNSTQPVLAPPTHPLYV